METLVGYLLHGLFPLAYWQGALLTLIEAQIVIAAVTIYLHRHQAHRALDLAPPVAHFFRSVVWFYTGMITSQWVAVHRKHHAHCESKDDPHSPLVYGIGTVLMKGVFLYQDAATLPSTQRYVYKNGRPTPGLPDDWIERSLYARHNWAGVVLMFLVHIALLGPLVGGAIALTLALWIPLWAAGVINGIGHWFGYRGSDTPDVSTNIVPFGLWIGGEELHNNHHAYPTSAKFSLKWYECDIGWGYIRALEIFGLAKVKHLAPRYAAPKPVPDRATLALLNYDYGRIPRMLRELLYKEVKSELRQKKAPSMLREELLELRRTLKEWDWRESDIVHVCARAKERLAETGSAIPMIAEFGAILRDVRRGDALSSKESERELLVRLETWIAGMGIIRSGKELVRFIERGQLYRANPA